MTAYYARARRESLSPQAQIADQYKEHVLEHYTFLGTESCPLTNEPFLIWKSRYSNREITFGLKDNCCLIVDEARDYEEFFDASDPQCLHTLIALHRLDSEDSIPGGKIITN